MTKKVTSSLAPATKTSTKKKPTKPYKSKKASSGLLASVGALLDRALKAPPKSRLQTMSEDKLFEVLALARLLSAYKHREFGSTVVHIPPAPKVLKKPLSSVKAKAAAAKPAKIVVAGGPASRNRAKFSHFELHDSAGVVQAEAWVSLKVHALSWVLRGAPTPVPLAGLHELDVALVDPGTSPYPRPEEVCVGVSCKNRGTSTKEHVREALGLRRETALLSDPTPSRAPWLMRHVPADPASPLLLLSSDVGVTKYREPVDAFGVYVRFLRFRTYL